MNVSFLSVFFSCIQNYILPFKSMQKWFFFLYHTWNISAMLMWIISTFGEGKFSVRWIFTRFRIIWSIWIILSKKWEVIIKENEGWLEEPINSNLKLQNKYYKYALTFKYIYNSLYKKICDKINFWEKHVIFPFV